MDGKLITYKYEAKSEQDMLYDSKTFYELLNKRRSVRSFSSREIPMEVLENLIRTAGTAPSGAHKQPWVFCVITSKELKAKIREAAEEEERQNYAGRMSDRWIQDLKPLGTDDNKPFIEEAPALIVMFKRVFEAEEGKKINNYYVNESVGIAAGILISAIHNAGLVTLTHTPSPMNFLERILERPTNERAFLLLPVGYPMDKVQVPDLERKELSEIMKLYK